MTDHDQPDLKPGAAPEPGGAADAAALIRAGRGVWIGGDRIGCSWPYRVV